jgi:small nuclear ribonucleoprotein (snRNP)-like protein
MQAYDQHMNMVLAGVEETLTTREIDLETTEEIVKVNAEIGWSASSSWSFSSLH